MVLLSSILVHTSAHDFSRPTLLHDTFAHNWTWKVLRDGLLPPNLARRVDALEGNHPFFIFYGPGSLDLSADDVPVPSPQRPLRCSFATLVARISAKRNDAPSAPFIYYSAQLASARDGAVVRAIKSPVSRALAEHAASTWPLGAVQANVFVGSAGSCTPLHYDAGPNVISHLVGYKRVVLYPPEAVVAARLWPWTSSAARSARAGVDGSADAAAPLGSHAAEVFNLSPGDTLFIPEYWLHHVCVSDASGAASASAWTETKAQVAARTLLGSALPVIENSDVPCGRAIAVCALLLRLLAEDLALEVAAVLRSRFEHISGSPVAGDPLDARDTAFATSLLITPTASAFHFATYCSHHSKCTWFDTAHSVGVTAEAAHWLAEARAVLRIQRGNAIRAIIIANWFENALMRVLIDRNDSERQRRNANASVPVEDNRRLASRQSTIAKSLRDVMLFICRTIDGY